MNPIIGIASQLTPEDSRRTSLMLAKLQCRVIAQHFDSAERDSENELCQRADAMGYTGGETRETKLAQR